MSDHPKVSTIAVPALIVLGCAALILRPAATWTAVLITAAVGLMGLFVRVPPDPGPRPAATR